MKDKDGDLMFRKTTDIENNFDFNEIFLLKGAKPSKILLRVFIQY